MVRRSTVRRRSQVTIPQYFNLPTLVGSVVLMALGEIWAPMGGEEVQRGTP